MPMEIMDMGREERAERKERDRGVKKGNETGGQGMTGQGEWRERKEVEERRKWGGICKNKRVVFCSKFERDR